MTNVYIEVTVRIGHPTRRIVAAGPTTYRGRRGRERRCVDVVVVVVVVAHGRREGVPLASTTTTMAFVAFFVLAAPRAEYPAWLRDDDIIDG